MCRELARLAQGYADTEGTNMMQFLTLEEIKNIWADRTVTYARIVVDYCHGLFVPFRARSLLTWLCCVSVVRCTPPCVSSR